MLKQQVLTINLQQVCRQQTVTSHANASWYQRVETRKREMFSQKSVRRFVGDSSALWFVMGAMIRHGRHVVSQCPKQKHFPPVLVKIFNISGGWMPLFRALAKNMAPMTNADESPTNRLTLFMIYLSLFVVSTLWWYWLVENRSVERCQQTCCNLRVLECVTNGLMERNSNVVLRIALTPARTSILDAQFLYTQHTYLPGIGWLFFKFSRRLYRGKWFISPTENDTESVLLYHVGFEKSVTLKVIAW